MSLLKISIAIATYNGERFLPEQLDSLFGQTRLPDEIVISDDCSTDATLGIIRNHKICKSVEVITLKNDEKLGVAQNFGKAIERCTGDVIFLCDQDDVWLENKIKFVENEFRLHPGMGIFVNNAEYMNSEGVPMGVSRMQHMQYVNAHIYPMITGCCTAFRSDLRKYIIPIPQGVGYHDAWLHHVCSFVTDTRRSQVVLQYYRRHEGNVTPSSSSGRYEVGFLKHFFKLFRSALVLARFRYSEELHCRHVEALGRLRLLDQERLEHFENEIYKDAIRRAERTIEVFMLREQLFERPRHQRMTQVIKLFGTGGYDTFSGWKSALRDLLS